MKTKVLSVIFLLGLGTLSVLAGPGKTGKFKVAGNCGMCEDRIEKAATDIDGVSKAEWNKETKMVEITFDAEKTSVEKVQKAIATVGHDTELFRAEDSTYDKLPGCCKYDRMEYAADKGAKKSKK